MSALRIKLILTAVCIIALYFVGYHAVERTEWDPQEEKSVAKTTIAPEATNTDKEKTKADAELIDINTATAEELDTLPGIGTKKAEAIVEVRRKMYGFKTVDDILCVDGIGEKMMEKIRGMIKAGEYKAE